MCALVHANICALPVFACAYLQYMCICIHWSVLLCKTPAPFPGACLGADKDAILSRLKYTAK